MKSKASDAGPDIDYPTFCRLCEGKYPPEIAGNLDIIFRAVLYPVRAPGQPGFAGRLRRALGSRYRMEIMLVRNAVRRWRSRRAGSGPAPSRVLALLYPYRPDCHGLLSTVTNLLADQDVPTSLLLSRDSFRVHDDPELFRGSRFLFEEDFYSVATYRRARMEYRRLLTSLEGLSSELRLGQDKRHSLKTFYQVYCIQKEAFTEVLQAVRPSVVYGIHFISTPGILAAIDGRRSKSARPLKILIQHGHFRSGRFHDFKGADRVLVWGPYFKSMLESEFLIPVPMPIVVGNPKLEFESTRLAANRALAGAVSSTPGRSVVLYVSTPDGQQQDYNRKAVTMFAEAMRSHTPPVEVIYKPHPADDLGTYESLIQRHVIGKEQVLHRSMSLYPLIDRADVVVGTNSTSLVEAMALGKPVIQMLPAESGTNWVQSGVPGAATPGELEHTLDALLDDPERRDAAVRAERELARDMHGEYLGSSQRIAEYITGLLGEELTPRRDMSAEAPS